ncbi:DUF1801 domain-containing protein [Paraflavitalea soli]|uniref:DUF1801 domain-containing protein n=1 Tax=Paraflavitalea soli TaxID=2315862 RepID=A0A3B7MYY1_9BACT|nr:DUF1801 domain-containing protein [Paraflavitalea soli]AXY78813.1 DUF1801 domain-containing protein [Paraflavitalea soli]
MAKANKTTETTASVTGFLNGVADETRRKDGFRIVEIMQAQTGFEPKMWGPAIVGFGSYHYKYESGREGDAPLVGFSPRKDAFALYLSANFDKREELLLQLGKHKAAKGCVYIKKLADVKEEVLKKMILLSFKHVKKLYPSK